MAYKRIAACVPPFVFEALWKWSSRIASFYVTTQQHIGGQVLRFFKGRPSAVKSTISKCSSFSMPFPPDAKRS